MTKIFREMLYKTVECYVDDLVVKSRKEVDPAIQEIEMPPPRTEKKIRGFLGRVQYISRFISQLTSTCEPIHDDSK